METEKSEKDRVSWRKRLRERVNKKKKRRAKRGWAVVADTLPSLSAGGGSW